MYAIEYVINENEGSQLEYVDKDTYVEVALSNNPQDVRKENGTFIVFDKVGAYYA